jgi:hypothetical protein
MNTNKKISPIIFFISPIIQIILPGSIESIFWLNLWGYPFFIFNIINLGAFIFILRKMNIKFDAITYTLFLGIAFSLISGMFANDYVLQRIFLNNSFYIVGIFLHQYDYIIDRKWMYRILLVIYCFVILQIVSVSLGIIHIDTGIQYTVGRYVRRGTTIGAATITGYMLLVLTILLTYLKQVRIFQIIIVSLTALSFFLSSTRGPLVALALGIILTIIKGRITFNYKKLVYLIIFILCTVILDTSFHFTESVVLRTTGTTKSIEDFTSGRYSRISDAYSFFKKSSFIKQIFGSGGALSPYYYQGKDSISPTLSPHNEYVTYLVENGIVGASIFIILVGLIISKCLNARNFHSYSMIGIVLIMFNIEVISRMSIFTYIFWIMFEIFSNPRSRIEENCNI